MIAALHILTVQAQHKDRETAITPQPMINKIRKAVMAQIPISEIY